MSPQFWRSLPTKEMTYGGLAPSSRPSDWSQYFKLTDLTCHYSALIRPRRHQDSLETGFPDLEPYSFLLGAILLFLCDICGVNVHCYSPYCYSPYCYSPHLRRWHVVNEECNWLCWYAHYNRQCRKLNVRENLRWRILAWNPWYNTRQEIVVSDNETSLSVFQRCVNTGQKSVCYATAILRRCLTSCGYVRCSTA